MMATRTVAPSEGWFTRAGVLGAWTWALGAYLVLLGVLLTTLVVLNQGHMVYLLDDAYIHLAIARDLVVHGTWGVVPGAYESASSSPLWTLALALVTLVGGPLAVWAPLLLNVVAAAVLLWLLVRDQGLVDFTASLWDRTLLALLPVILLLVPLTLVGMEHLWHAVLVVAAMGALARILERGADGRTVVILLGLLALGTLVRMENVFLGAGCAAAAVVAFAVRHLPPKTAALLVSGAVSSVAAPVLALGAINLANGQFFFANSVTAKTALGAAGSALLPSPEVYAGKLTADPMLATMVLLSLAVLVCAVLPAGRRLRIHTPLIAAFAVMAALHLAFAGVGWYDRYQAYLIIAGVYLILRLAPPLSGGRHHSVVVGVLLAALVLLAGNKLILTIYAPVASNNIYSQQYQLGRFFSRYYDGRGILIHELGATAYMHDGPLVDLYGLASHDVLAARRQGRLNADFVRSTSSQHGVVAAAVYGATFADVIPPDWVKVGSWTLDRPAGNLGGTQMDFYAPDQARAQELRADLVDFRSALPNWVQVRFGP